MRYDVKKFLFVGVEEDKELFFKKAQEVGIIHFIDRKGGKFHAVTQEVGKLTQAIKILRGLPTKDQEETEDYDLADGLTQKILCLKEKLNSLTEEEKILKLDISRVEAFGDFSMDDIAYIQKEGNRKVQFYCAKQDVYDGIKLPQDVIYVNSEHGLDYFVAINKEAKQYPKMIEMHIDHPLGELKKRYQSSQQEFHETDHRLKDYAKYNRLLHHALINKLNTDNLKTAQSFVDFPLKDTNLFVVEGWVPVHKIKELYHLVKEMNVHVEEIAVDPNEHVPTCLENEGAGRIGEDLVHIYDTPSNTDKDPSMWVLVFFSLFFSMIVGDAGYGLVFLLVAIYIQYKYSPFHKVGNRLWGLWVILSFSCIAWGFLTTSFFGITFAPNSPIRKYSLMHWLVEKKVAYHMKQNDATYREILKEHPQLKGITDPNEFLMKATTVNPQGHFSYDVLSKFSDNIMMEFALLIGVVHVILSMGRNLKRNLTGIGWIIFLIGCYFYIPSFLDATSIIHFVFGVDKTEGPRDGLYLIFGGIVIAEIIALFKYRLLGVLEVMTIIQIFTDILSYLRLYALGLSGALFTATVNELAGSVVLVLGIVLVFIGHCVNMLLGIMGGVIHGLRLNFLEWYHYSFEGGGKMFTPLQKKEIE
jgi:V/A-type H+/Na+-transporting ATPase subunit I